MNGKRQTAIRIRRTFIPYIHKIVLHTTYVSIVCMLFKHFTNALRLKTYLSNRWRLRSKYILDHFACELILHDILLCIVLDEHKISFTYLLMCLWIYDIVSHVTYDYWYWQLNGFGFVAPKLMWTQMKCDANILSENSFRFH